VEDPNMSELSKDELLAFVDEIDTMIEKLENHPILQNYYIGVVDQLKSFNKSARNDINNS
jgi:hypothetical protein